MKAGMQSGPRIEQSKLWQQSLNECVCVCMCEGEREAEPGTDDNINIGLKLMKELLLPDCSSFCLDVETVVDWVFFYPNFLKIVLIYVFMFNRCRLNGS